MQNQLPHDSFPRAKQRITIFTACNCEIPRNCPVSFYKEFKIVCIVGLTSDSVLWQPCLLQCWVTHSFQGSAELSSTEDSLKISEMKATPPYYSIRNKRSPAVPSPCSLVPPLLFMKTDACYSVFSVWVYLFVQDNVYTQSPLRPAISSSASLPCFTFIMTVYQ